MAICILFRAVNLVSPFQFQHRLDGMLHLVVYLE
jgi:hypothetical protein